MVFKNEAIQRNEATGKLEIRRYPIEIYFLDILEEAKNRHEVEFIANFIAQCLLQAGMDTLHDLGDEEYCDLEFNI